eukprot:NODE_13_length_42895_cov_0.518413.p12 type:complete len:351 gc:universal NODE_13_length_42895_cov_0.518413:17365-18417(+)
MYFYLSFLNNLQMLYHGSFKEMNVYSSIHNYAEWPGISVSDAQVFVVDNSLMELQHLLIKVQTWYNANANIYSSPTTTDLFSFDQLKDVAIVSIPNLSIKSTCIADVFLKYNTMDIIPITFKPVKSFESKNKPLSADLNYFWQVNNIVQNALFLTRESLDSSINRLPMTSEQFIIKKIQKFCNIELIPISIYENNVVCKINSKNPTSLISTSFNNHHSFANRSFKSESAGAIAGLFDLIRFFKLHRSDSKVAFVFFSSESLGHKGSKHFFDLYPISDFTHHVHLNHLFNLFYWQYTDSIQLNFYNRFIPTVVSNIDSSSPDLGILSMNINHSVISSNLDAVVHAINQFSK